eukprot:TRINITY_DN12206_c0_g1_i1.p1 TRINITY_DN12206_c0_g1~~TRINITY_DN12206_c0_g1_i1.p1  ORF type:complete len:876 (-),score=234.24 TRINITY_DN12206_c0_g1_i1:159-2786(-)
MPLRAWPAAPSKLLCAALAATVVWREADAVQSLAALDSPPAAAGRLAFDKATTGVPRQHAPAAARGAGAGGVAQRRTGRVTLAVDKAAFAEAFAETSTSRSVAARTRPSAEAEGGSEPAAVGAGAANDSRVAQVSLSASEYEDDPFCARYLTDQGEEIVDVKCGQAGLCAGQLRSEDLAFKCSFKKRLCIQKRYNGTALEERLVGTWPVANTSMITWNDNSTWTCQEECSDGISLFRRVEGDDWFAEFSAGSYVRQEMLDNGVLGPLRAEDASSGDGFTDIEVNMGCIAIVYSADTFAGSFAVLEPGHYAKARVQSLGLRTELIMSLKVEGAKQYRRQVDELRLAEEVRDPDSEQEKEMLGHTSAEEDYAETLGKLAAQAQEAKGAYQDTLEHVKQTAMKATDLQKEQVERLESVLTVAAEAHTEEVVALQEKAKKEHEKFEADVVKMKQTSDQESKKHGAEVARLVNEHNEAVSHLEALAQQEADRYQKEIADLDAEATRRASQHKVQLEQVHSAIQAQQTTSNLLFATLLLTICTSVLLGLWVYLLRDVKANAGKDVVVTSSDRPPPATPASAGAGRKAGAAFGSAAPRWPAASDSSSEEEGESDSSRSFPGGSGVQPRLDLCGCGSFFMPNSMFCRKCGAARPAPPPPSHAPEETSPLPTPRSEKRDPSYWKHRAQAYHQKLLGHRPGWMASQGTSSGSARPVSLAAGSAAQLPPASPRQSGQSPAMESGPSAAASGAAAAPAGDVGKTPTPRASASSQRSDPEAAKAAAAAAAAAAALPAAAPAEMPSPQASQPPQPPSPQPSQQQPVPLPHRPSVADEADGAAGGAAPVPLLATTASTSSAAAAGVTGSVLVEEASGHSAAEESAGAPAS